MNNANWSYNGLTFGLGTSFNIIETDGIDGRPSVVKGDQQKSNADGAFGGIDFLTERTVTLKLAVGPAVSTAAYDALKDQIGTAFQPQPFAEMALLYDNASRLINCRPARCEVPRKREWMGIYGEALIELVATDPRRYDAALQQIATGLATTSGGVAFPVVFPATFGAVGAGGTVNCTNAGFWPTSPLLTITGPVVNPIVDCLTTGQTLSLLTTLASTDVLQIDTSARSILLNPTTSQGITTGANRYSALQPGSAWFVLAPGTSQIRYRNSGGATASQLTVAFRNAYL